MGNLPIFGRIQYLLHFFVVKALHILSSNMLIYMFAGRNFPRTQRIDARKIPVIKIDEKDSYLYRYVQYSQNSTDQCGAICHAGCSVNVAQSKHRPTAIFRTYAFGRRMMMMKILFFFLSSFNDIFPTVSKVFHLTFLYLQKIIIQIFF